MTGSRLLAAVLVFLLVSGTGTGNGNDWRISVDAARTVARYNPLIQGNNINWVNQGDGLYDPAAGTVKAQAKHRIREMGVKVLRFPGGNLAEYYDWKGGIGSSAQRQSGLDYERKPQKMEFGIDEFLKLCESLDIIPVVTVGYANNTPSSAAELVQYCNGAPSTPMGALRARNGHPEPYRVGYWEIGNEVYHKGITRDKAAAYGRKASEMALAMKRVDPAIKIGAIGLGVSLEWDESMLKECAGQVDFLIYHRYLPNTNSSDPSEVNNAVIVAAEKIAREVRRLRETAARFNPALSVAVTEYNLDFRDSAGNNINKPSDIQQALFVAECMRLFQLNQVSFATKWDLAHFSRHYMSDLHFNRNKEPTLAPSYFAQKLFADAGISTIVNTTVSSPTVSVSRFGEIRNENNVPVLTSLAGRDASGRALSLIVINRDLNNSYTVNLDIRNFPGAARVELLLLKTPPGGVTDRFLLERSDLKPGDLRSVVIPAGSISLYRVSS